MMIRSKFSTVLSGPVHAFVYKPDVIAEIAALGDERLRIAEHAVEMQNAVSCNAAALAVVSNGPA